MERTLHLRTNSRPMKDVCCRLAATPQGARPTAAGPRRTTMRTARLLSAIPVLLACGLAVHADSAPYEATVTAPEVEVRCGPSADPKYYATSKLRQGDKVQ